MAGTVSWLHLLAFVGKTAMVIIHVEVEQESRGRQVEALFQVDVVGHLSNRLLTST